MGAVVPGESAAECYQTMHLAEDVETLELEASPGKSYDKVRP